VTDGVGEFHIYEGVSHAKSGKAIQALREAGFEVRETDDPDVMEVYDR